MANKRVKSSKIEESPENPKNDGIEEKIFTNSKKDRMEKKVQKKHTHTKKS